MPRIEEGSRGRSQAEAGRRMAASVLVSPPGQRPAASTHPGLTAGL